jgi:hypothetical protein
MARGRPSLGMFGVFGRSGDLRALDQALRAADLHPSLIPDAVKLTVLNLLKDAKGEDPAAEDYCALGREAFASANGDLAATAAERRILAALEASDGLDASLILLALRAAIIHPGVKETYQLGE